MKIIKYLINIAFMCLMIWFPYLSYAIIVRVPESGKLMDLIWSQIRQVLPAYSISILIISSINFLFERKIEKRKSSHEFLKLSLIHLLIITFAIVYYSIDFYNYSMQNN
jgi:uncharacterized membrane protein